MNYSSQVSHKLDPFFTRTLDEVLPYEWTFLMGIYSGFINKATGPWIGVGNAIRTEV